MSFDKLKKTDYSNMSFEDMAVGVNKAVDDSLVGNPVPSAPMPVATDILASPVPVSDAPVVSDDLVPVELDSVQATKKSTKSTKATNLSKMPKRERKTAAIYIKVTPTLKARFEAVCKENGVSQAEMIAYWIDNIAK